MRARLRALLLHLKREHADPVRLGWAVAVGVFVGVLPLYGLHLPICIGIALLLRLNKATTLLASQISLPIFAPLWIAAGIVVGEWVRFGAHRGVSLDDARSFLGGIALAAGALPDRFLSCLLGDALIGLVLGASAGLATWWWARRRADAPHRGPEAQVPSGSPSDS
ncbi:MAG: DUF2062 domain-containing protein [Myxococcota bacterium]